MKRESWKIFDQIYGNYDRINRILSFGMDSSWRRAVARYLPAGSNLQLLDLASGTLDQLIACMESKASIQSAIGIDLSERMLEVGKRKIKDKPYCDKVSIRLGDAQNLPFSDALFDAITFSFGVRNLPDPKKGLCEMHRLLKPNGRALILEFSLSKFPFKPVHLFYLRHILPKIGGLLSRNKDAYHYLHETIETFPFGNHFCSWMKEAGFCLVKTIPLALGAVTLYVGEKGDGSFLV